MRPARTVQHASSELEQVGHIEGYSISPEGVRDGEEEDARRERERGRASGEQASENPAFSVKEGSSEAVGSELCTPRIQLMAVFC